MTAPRISLLALAVLGLVPAVASASPILPGTYVGKATGVRARVTIDDQLGARLRYSLKTACGRSRASVSLAPTRGGSYKGHRSSSRSSITARLRPVGSGAELAGKIREVRDADGRRCHARRRFTAHLDGSSSAMVRDSSGHYLGTGQDGGLPISFDVAFSQAEGSLWITNLDLQTSMECWNDLDGDGEDDTLVARIGGMEGRIDGDGSFVIDYAPDDDTEYDVEGSIVDGQATMDVTVGGFFDQNGVPAVNGPLECDSWGETYVANRQP